MKHGDKVYYHRSHVKQSATWICWIVRGNRRIAMVKVEGSHATIEASPRYVDIEFEKEVYKYGQ